MQNLQVIVIGCLSCHSAFTRQHLVSAGMMRHMQQSASSSHITMLAILNRKYPLKTGDWKNSLLQALIVFLILYLLKPFGLDKYDEFTGALLPVCMGYAAITFVAEVAYQHTVRAVARRKSSWTVGHVLLSGMLFWLFVGVCNFVYSVIIFQVDRQHIGLVFFYFIYWTVLIGLFLTLVSTLVNYNRYLKSELAQMINKTTDEKKHITLSIHDHTVRGDKLDIAINDFLYAESMKNDLKVWYYKDGQVQSQTFRMTMSQLMEQMPYENIFQCHRSFIINVNNISDAKGNSNGYLLKMGAAPNLVPVSRPNVPSLKAFLR